MLSWVWDMGTGCYGVGLPLLVGLEVQECNTIAYNNGAAIMM